MGLFRNRVPVPEPPPAPQPKDLLDLLGAVPLAEIGVPREGDCFVYGLDNADGECFYVGLSESLYTRLGVWQKTYGDYLAAIRVLRCRDEDDMNVTENFLICRMQPAMNINGNGNEELRRKARARKAPKPDVRSWTHARAELGRQEGVS